MSPRPVVTALAVALGLLSLAGCASAGEPSGTAEEASPVGTWRADAPGEAWLEIGDDGTVSGSDGCNQISGTAEVDGDSVDFTMGFSTLIACPGVSVSFRDLTSGSVEGDILTTRAADGSDIVSLRRSVEAG